MLKLTLHDKLVGYLAGFNNGRNVLIFADEFKYNLERPTLSLITNPKFPKSSQFIDATLTRNQRLHPILSNLLPEGVMREAITDELKIHIDNEFSIISYLGSDLPGALVATPMDPDEVPELKISNSKVKAVKIDNIIKKNKFSLAGVQLKFSMQNQNGEFKLAKDNMLGDWIIKPPSIIYRDVPLNEYTGMTLASLAGIDIPEIKLIELNKIIDLPQDIKLPNEKMAFAIKRFDRNQNKRIHMEDFAQVLVKYPYEKYDSANYEQIGKIIYEYSDNGLQDVQQFAQRLLVNILLANGDAHLKNWSLLYSDKITPILPPAYDVLTTSVYIKDEKEYALNLGKNKDWYDVSYENFEYWSNKVGISWKSIKPHLDDTMEKARSLWIKELKTLPMNEMHKKNLIEHWRNLHANFKIL